jgi:hypothetical protein
MWSTKNSCLKEVEWSEFDVRALKRLLERIPCLKPQFWCNGSGSFSTTTSLAILVIPSVADRQTPFQLLTWPRARRSFCSPKWETPSEEYISGHQGRQEECNHRIICNSFAFVRLRVGTKAILWDSPVTLRKDEELRSMRKLLLLKVLHR